MRRVDRYTFESFKVDDSNRFAFKRAQDAAEDLGALINPLWIFGASGLGKTHLLNAIANRAAERSPDVTVGLWSAEELTAELIKAYGDGREDKWETVPRTDMLLIDDLNFLVGKKYTQEAFLSLIRSFVEEGRQVVMTSSVYPAEVTEFYYFMDTVPRGGFADVTPQEKDPDLSDGAKKLYAVLFTKSFDAAVLEALLSSGELNADDINSATYEYINDCIYLIDSDDPRYENAAFGENIPGVESSHLLEAMEILLRFGLDPNYTRDGSITGSIMHILYFVFNGYQAADAAALMLTHGGDPNLNYKDDLDFDISWFLGGDEESRYLADSFMHYYMVFVGAGAKWSDGSDVLETFDGFEVSELLDHRNFYCGFIHVTDENEPLHTTAVSFFDKRTNREVARL